MDEDHNKLLTVAATAGVIGLFAGIARGVVQQRHGGWVPFFRGLIASVAVAILVGWGLDDATLGAAYSDTITATGASPLLFRVVAGALPPGLSMDDETGAVTGTPTLAGGFPFTVEVSNAFDPPAVRQFSIRVVGAASSATPSPWTAVLKGR
ncbi:MAG: putative Ig domain-containing protein [Burkholderiales bacterium]|nr:putative Ig domain-containing protein [Burkholderiales bacterium]